MIQISIEDIEKIIKIEMDLAYIKGRIDLIEEIQELNGKSLEELLNKIKNKSNEEATKLLIEYEKALKDYGSLLKELDEKDESVGQTEKEN